MPFCQTKCLYCAFYQQASRQQAEDAYVEALLKEIAHDAKLEQIRTATIDSVFFGGGTPTSLSPANAGRLLAAVREQFHLAPDAEVTMEGRVHDLVPEKIEAWLVGGVNRISLGVQSFDTALRRRVGRIDAREEVLRRLALLRREDVTIIADLIYGLPGQDLASWLADIRTLAEADVDGMDLYQLNIFPGSDLEKALRTGRVLACADLAGQADLYLAARDQLLAEGTERLSFFHWRRRRLSVWLRRRRQFRRPKLYAAEGTFCLSADGIPRRKAHHDDGASAGRARAAPLRQPGQRPGEGLRRFPPPDDARFAARGARICAMRPFTCRMSGRRSKDGC
ncbi:radical SAM protein [uncultured Mitsuokella sp.]|uniref:radical SAM protein n=1 Tax=uncultured Mitsuokella sp. TaxID=453120 RepID=UPI0026DC9247|nr:radical SAM protein [uncultured Mitsuokella sp.]